VNYLNNDKVFFDIYGHHQRKIHLKKAFIWKILPIIVLMIHLGIYLNCKFIDLFVRLNSIEIYYRDYHQHQQRTTNDDDQESGTGNSIPQSPFREHEAS
jgi:hypothetical protein